MLIDGLTSGKILSANCCIKIAQYKTFRASFCRDIAMIVQKAAKSNIHSLNKIFPELVPSGYYWRWLHAEYTYYFYILIGEGWGVGKASLWALCAR